MLEITQTYHRKKDILYDESGTEILKFLEKTNDRENLTSVLVENMNNYIRCYPERIQKIEPKQNLQLNLF